MIDRSRPALRLVVFTILIAAVALASTSASSRPAAATQVRYTVTALEALGGASSYALGINNRGQVAGWAALPGDTTFHAVLWSAAGQARDLGTLPGDNDSFAYDVNNAGVVAARSGFFPGQHAVRWEDGVMADLGTLGGPNSEAQAINSAGVIVGYAEPGQPASRAAAWLDGEIVDLGVSDASIASDVNDGGQIVGFGYEFLRAWVYKRGEVLDLGTLGGSGSEAHAINNVGDIVGSANPAGDAEIHAVLWHRGRIRDLGTLDSFEGAYATAFDINDGLEIVGFSTLCCGPFGTPHAFISNGGQMTDLNDLIPAGTGWELNYATAINNRGQIVGYGFLNGVERAFVLNPY